MTTQTHAYRSIAPKPRARYLNVRLAMRGLASIHDGINGQSIPREVMEFYTVLKNGDRFRSQMLREVVLGIEAAVKEGISYRVDLQEIILKRLADIALRLPIDRLKKWFASDPRRAKFIPTGSNNLPDRLRVGWLEEAAEMVEDTLNYAEALVADARAAA